MRDDDGLPWRHGAKAGAVAWCVGYLTISLIVVVGLGIGTVVTNPFAVLVESLLFFLATHGWPLILATSVPVQPGLVLFLPVPAMFLFAAGYRVATVRGVRWNTRAYRTGATVILGYAGMTLCSLLFLTVVLGGSAPIAVYIFIFGFTGLILPLIAGGVGGVVAAR